MGKEKVETLEEKLERLRPMFERSYDWYYPENVTEKGSERGQLEVTRKKADGTIETIKDLITMDITDEGPELAGIEDDGYPTASAVMFWEEIIDAKVKE